MANDKTVLALSELSKNKLKEALLTVLNAAKNNGELIVSGRSDPLTKEFFLVKKSGEEINLGAVGQKGDPGTDGRFVVDVQLVEDPEQNNAVFFKVELSDGVILQTRDSISGYHGKSVSGARIENDSIIFTLEGDIDLDPVPVSGLTPISINGARISAERELLFSLTNGEEISAGLASDLKGRGVQQIFRQAGKLFIKYDDDPDTNVDLGELVGISNIQMVDGSLVITTDNDTAEPINLGAIGSFTGAYVEDGKLFIRTNQPAPDDILDLGPVENLRGEDGVGITDVLVEDNTFTIVLTNGTRIDRAVSGLKPIHVTGARFDSDANEIYLVLSNGAEISTGIGNDFKGESVTSVSFNPLNGELSVQFTNDENPTVIGNIPVLTDITIEADGKMMAKWSHEEEPRELTVAKFVDKIERDPETGKVSITFNTTEVTSLGYMKTIESIDIDGDDLLVTMTGEEPRIIGSLRGPKGDNGVSIASATLSDRGHLIIAYTDDREPEDVGLVRTTIQNLLGRQYQFKFSDGPDFPASHEGQVLLSIAGEIIALGDIDLSVNDTVTYTGSKVYEADDVVSLIVFVKAGPSESGKGIFKVDKVDDHVYNITLEDGSIWAIDTQTIIDRDALNIPSDITSAELIAGNLTLIKEDGTRIEVGQVQEVISVKNAYVADDGVLHIVLTDDRDIPTVSVVADVTIKSVEIRPDDGHLIVTMNNDEVHDGGPIANYVTDAVINENDDLMITTSDGRTFKAGSVRNPLLGTVYEYTAFEGQVDIPLAHGEFKPIVWVKGIALQDEHLILDNPNKITLKTARNEGDYIKVMLLSKGSFSVDNLNTAYTAADDTYYGKNAEGEIGFHPNRSQLTAVPKTITVDNDNQTTINHIHSHYIDIYKNGTLMHDGYTSNESKTMITFDVPLVKSDKIRIIDYSRPQIDGALIQANYARVSYNTLSHGGTLTRNVETIRDLNAVEDNSIGVRVHNNRIIIPAGTYKLKGWAACKGVGQNFLKLYNVTESKNEIVGFPQFAPLISSSGFYFPDFKTEIDGMFKVETEVALILQHIGAVTRATDGLGTGLAGGGNSSVKSTDFPYPSRLVDIQIWKID